jgi:hypothetical protein
MIFSKREVEREMGAYQRLMQWGHHRLVRMHPTEKNDYEQGRSSECEYWLSTLQQMYDEGKRILEHEELGP